MILPLCPHGNPVTNDLVAIFGNHLGIETGYLPFPDSLGHISERIALASKTKDEFLAPCSPVFNADIQCHVKYSY